MLSSRNLLLAAASAALFTMASCVSTGQPSPAAPVMPSDDGASHERALFQPLPLAQLQDEAQEQAPAGEPDAAAQANNPLANLTALNLQNYHIPELSGSDENANQFWVRYAQPFEAFGGDWLLRASMPVSRFPTGVNQSESGLGDSNVFATYLFDTGNPAVSFGAGPLLGIPTATDDAIGNDQWSLGAAAIYFDGSDKQVQWGGLATYQHKIAGSDRVGDANLATVQPFGFLQLGDGTYLRAAPIWAFDLETGNFSVPVGLGIGKVVKMESTVINMFVEPQFSILDEGPGQPEFQVYFGMNMQFYGR